MEMDTRDNRYNPSDGGYYRIWNSTLEPLGENTELTRLHRTGLKLQQILPLPGMGEPWLAWIRMQAENRSMESGDPPRAEWIRFGGANTLRGHAERVFASSGVLTGSFELRRLLSRQSRVFALLDAAVYRQDSSSRGLWAWGGGVQLSVQQGFLNVALAVPGGEGFSATTLHVSLSTAF
ncbi:BamA/TamA family outer membrane protein [bacterium]|nr:BamA/TamA family outer membrane protein [bacterium]